MARGAAVRAARQKARSIMYECMTGELVKSPDEMYRRNLRELAKWLAGRLEQRRDPQPNSIYGKTLRALCYVPDRPLRGLGLQGPHVRTVLRAGPLPAEDVCELVDWYGTKLLREKLSKLHRDTFSLARTILRKEYTMARLVLRPELEHARNTAFDGGRVASLSRSFQAGAKAGYDLAMEDFREKLEQSYPFSDGLCRAMRRWLAPGIFAPEPDRYAKLAADILGCNPYDVTSEQRERAKRAALELGYSE